MASIIKKPGSKYYHACYRDYKGVQRRKSTKETDRVRAQRLAELMERGAKRKIRTDRVRHAVREVFEEYYPDELPHTTVKEHADRWLAAKKSEVAPSTYLSYWNSAEKFLKHIGDLAEQDICEIRKPTIASFRDHVQN